MKKLIELTKSSDPFLPPLALSLLVAALRSSHGRLPADDHEEVEVGGQPCHGMRRSKVRMARKKLIELTKNFDPFAPERNPHGAGSGKRSSRGPSRGDTSSWLAFPFDRPAVMELGWSVLVVTQNPQNSLGGRRHVLSSPTVSRGRGSADGLAQDPAQDIQGEDGPGGPVGRL